MYNMYIFVVANDTNKSFDPADTGYLKCHARSKNTLFFFFLFFAKPLAHPAW